MSSDKRISEELGIGIGPSEIPTDRKRAGVDADRDTFHDEISFVVERHEGPLSRAEIVQALFDFADSYADVLDVPMDVEEATDPDGKEVMLVRFPEDDINPSPIGKWNPDELADKPSLAGRSSRGEQ